MGRTTIWAISILYHLRSSLAEACARLNYYGQDMGKVIELVCSKVLIIDFNTNAAAERLHRLMQKYADQPMDLADACLVVMSEDIANSTVMTLDRNDFRVYRRHAREAIPLIIPT